LFQQESALSLFSINTACSTAALHTVSSL